MKYSRPSPRRASGLTLLIASALFLSAADNTKKSFNLPAGAAGQTLKQFAAQAGCEIVFAPETAGSVPTKAVHGSFTPREALDLMLADTGLVASQDAKTGAFAVRKGAADPNAPRAAPVVAQSDRPIPTGSIATGTITGRVQNIATGQFLNNARVSVKGTTQSVYTDNFGVYQLVGVPSGSVVLDVFYTDLDSAQVPLTVEADRTITRDIGLTSVARYGKDVAVQLDPFVVAAARETNAQAIAINEQRFASNIKSVVSGDEYGDIGEGNVGAFLKFVPGVTIDMAGFQPNTVSVRGVPANNTPLTVDGQPIASAATSGTNRNFELVGLSMNNIARVEVTKTPTPDLAANSLGGAVNVISKSAFELSRPQFNYHVFESANGMYLSLGEKPGPGKGTTGWRIRPGMDFSYIVPRSKTFGFTFNGTYFSRFQQSYSSQPTWSPTGTNNAAGTAAAPALLSYRLPSAPAILSRESFSLTADWKFTPRDVLSAGASYSGTNQFTDIVDQTWTVGTVASYGPDFTRGNSGAGSVAYSTQSRRKAGATIFTNLKWRHTGPLWKLDAGAAWSNSTNHYRDADEGFFEQAAYNLRSVTMNFSGINAIRPSLMTATTTAGAPVDPTNINNATIGSVRNNQADVLAVIGSFNLNAQRSFSRTVPFTLKAGIDVRREQRDMRNPQLSRSFVGPDKVANTADDLVGRYDLEATGYSGQHMAWQLEPRRWQSTAKLWKLYQDHPDWFVLNETTAISTSANNSRQITETVSAAYLRADARLLNNRLLLVGGARYERTDDDGYGVLNDIRATYRQDAQGNLVLVSGRPERITTDTVALARLQYKERGAHSRRHYGDWYPSLNATLNLRDDLIARFAYARTLGRPNFVQIIPGTTVGDPTAATRTISVNNTGLTPWTANNWDVTCEYYPNRGGLMSVGAFRKDVRDFFGSVTTAATIPLLEQYGLSDDYLGYDLTTLFNAGNARVTGVEYAWRQRLEFLPAWARGVGVFFNGTEMQLSGATTADFSGFTDRTINWGVNLDRPRFSTKLNWNYTGRRRLAAVTGANVPAGTYQYLKSRLQLDVNAEFRLTRRLAAYATVRNLTNMSNVTENYAPNTPAYARTRQIDLFGAAYTFGLKGSF
jgi:TonB-dependent receptor